ncbi:hypothetical protein CPB86DRAFT_790854 [Serendipita vermifera]|nr:hypothetical protein CPB86DRAFT_790854 [Serendipita vermifera]
MGILLLNSDDDWTSSSPAGLVWFPLPASISSSLLAYLAFASAASFDHCPHRTVRPP